MDSKSLISDIVIDTEKCTHKKCKFCGKDLCYKDYNVLSCNYIISDIANGYERCNCEEAKKIWMQYDEMVEQEKNQKYYLKQINKLFKNNNLGKRQLNSTFENYVINEKNKKMYESLKRYTDKLLKNEINQGIFITGDCGVGKTYLASCIANELIAKERTVVFGTLIQLLDYIKSSYKLKETNDGEFIELYSNVDLLIIDDLGKEKPTE